jgi:hypothetical protein
MHVKSNPVQHEEVDFAELCTRMQAQMAEMEKSFYHREMEQQERYEAIVAELISQVSPTLHHSAIKAGTSNEDQSLSPFVSGA